LIKKKIKLAFDCQPKSDEVVSSNWESVFHASQAECGQHFLNSWLKCVISLSFLGFLFLPFVLRVTARRYYKMRAWRVREEMRGQNGERKRLLENLSANICACKGLFLLARGEIPFSFPKQL
jgi:hypothetical protein